MQSQIKFYEKVFLFIFLISLVIAGIYFSGGESIPYLSQKLDLKIIASRSYGLKPGSRVLMKDLEIGTVESVELNEQDKVEIFFRVKKKYHNKIRKDSIASIHTPPLIGTSDIVITPGNKKFPLLKSGDIITLKEPDDDLAGELSAIPKKIIPVVDNLNIILENFKILSDNLSRGHGSLGKFLKDDKIYDQTLTMIDELNKLVVNLHPVVENFAKTSENIPQITKDINKMVNNFSKIQGDLDAITKDVKNTTSNISKIVERIEKGEGTVGKILTDDGLYKGAEKTLSSASNILNKIDSINISPSMDTSFYGGQDIVVSKITTSVSSNKREALKLGGAFIGYKKEKLKAKPEFLFSQIISTKGMTASAGIIEGQVGGRIEFASKDKIFTLEGRKTSSSDMYDNDIDSFLLRSYFGYKLGENLRVKIGFNDILNNPKLLGGVVAGIDIK